jgi:hypothetical protein
VEFGEWYASLPTWAVLLGIAVYFFGIGLAMTLLDEHEGGIWVLAWPIILAVAITLAPIWIPLLIGAKLGDWHKARRDRT